MFQCSRPKHCRVRSPEFATAYWQGDLRSDRPLPSLYAAPATSAYICLVRTTVWGRMYLWASAQASCVQGCWRFRTSGIMNGLTLVMIPFKR